MDNGLVKLIYPLAFAFGFASSAVGQSPGLDCAKATSAVEELICKDNDLAPLDRKMALVYEAAVKDPDQASKLKSAQRKWIGERNACSESANVRSCIQSAYEQRIAEIQIQTGSPTATRSIGYQCAGLDQSKHLLVAFYNQTDPPSAVVTYGSQQVIAVLQRSGSGAKYGAKDMEFWEHHGEALFTWRGKQYTCSTKDVPQVGTSSGRRTAATANERGTIPSVAEKLPEVWSFLKKLSAGVNAGIIKSEGDFTERCRKFYTPDQMAKIEAVVPGWKHMASFEDGKTLWHVNLAMVALLQLDEYRSMSSGLQTAQQWIVFLHDIGKEPEGGRDHRHSFRSAAQAGRILPSLGFPVTASYPAEFQDWFNLTDTATRFDDVQRLQIQDNSKLPKILSGARRIFAEPTRTVVGAIALHQSVTSLAAWPVKAPLTGDQVMAYVDKEILPALLVLMLADSGGWNLFDPPTLDSMYKETRAVFRALPRPPSK